MGVGKSGQTLVDLCVQWVSKCIDRRVLRPGMRVPSIRDLARQRRVSPFTVAEAYERLVAQGHLQARRGSGFYVCARTATDGRAPTKQALPIDLSWLMDNMLADSAAQGPGLGVLPASWLKSLPLSEALRALGRERQSQWFGSGTGRGFEPLRAVAQQRLAALDIVAPLNRVVLTTGVTHALSLVVRSVVHANDAVLVLDPCWFGALGLLAAHGARAIAVPCSANGPDLEALERIAYREKPKLLIISSVAQNPTGLSLTEEMGARLVALARRCDFLIFEDDIYADLCSARSRPLAAIDQLDRVIYATGFSKTLASNIRVGYFACRDDLADRLVNAKVLSGFATPELNERLVHRLLVEGRFSKHMRVLRERLAFCRERAKAILVENRVRFLGNPTEGMFLWIETDCDTTQLAATLRAQKLLLAPGSLFSPNQSPSRWMRVNVTTPEVTLRRVIRSFR